VKSVESRARAHQLVFLLAALVLQRLAALFECAASRRRTAISVDGRTLQVA